MLLLWAGCYGHIQAGPLPLNPANPTPRSAPCSSQLALHHLISLRMTEQLDERRFIEHFYRVPVGMPVEPFSKQDRHVPE